MATFVSHGSEQHIAELQEMCARRRADLWTANGNVDVGDRVVFYVRRPISALVACGRARTAADVDGARHGWRGHRMAKVFVEAMLEPRVTLRQLRRLFPEWPWLKSPQSPARVPDEIDARLVAELKRRATNRIDEDRGRERDGGRDGGGFGASEQNAKVERATIKVVRARLEKEGWEVKSREAERCGYDLHCTQGRRELHVEVKGSSGSELKFVITRKEVAQARRDPRFQLIVVTRALKRPTFFSFNAKEFLERFELRPLSFMAMPK